MSRNPQDTIFALATPSGRSGVAVIRISGDAAFSSLAALGVLKNPAPRVATFTKLKDEDGEAIDQAVVIAFASPASFTGENVVEFQTHGSRAVISRIMAVLADLQGFRLAEPGEFTRRALMNGKMDLAEAEGLMDLIDAETIRQSRQALHFMEGHASARYASLRERIVKALSHLEAFIDFPDEDIPSSVQEVIDKEVRALENEITSILATDHYGEKIRDGFHIALLGAPNVGKSSLLNALAKRDVAIVSHIAGTTRDVIEVQMDIGGYAVTISDTAGVREGVGEIEEEGIRRSLKRAGEADINIILCDENNPEIPAELQKFINKNSIIAINKCDAGGKGGGEKLQISAKTGFGIGELINNISSILDKSIPKEPSIISRERHRKSLVNTLNHINNYHKQRELELRCEELRRAAFEIGAVTGAVDIEELLDQIFRQFCIGK